MTCEFHKHLELKNYKILINFGQALLLDISLSYISSIVLAALKRICRNLINDQLRNRMPIVRNNKSIAILFHLNSINVLLA